MWEVVQGGAAATTHAREEASARAPVPLLRAGAWPHGIGTTGAEAAATVVSSLEPSGSVAARFERVREVGGCGSGDMASLLVGEMHVLAGETATEGKDRVATAADRTDRVAYCTGLLGPMSYNLLHEDLEMPFG